jgi:hypothetical protein
MAHVGLPEWHGLGYAAADRDPSGSRAGGSPAHSAGRPPRRRTTVSRRPVRPALAVAAREGRTRDDACDPPWFPVPTAAALDVRIDPLVIPRYGIESRPEDLWRFRICGLGVRCGGTGRTRGGSGSQPPRKGRRLAGIRRRRSRQPLRRPWADGASTGVRRRLCRPKANSRPRRWWITRGQAAMAPRDHPLSEFGRRLAGARKTRPQEPVTSETIS